MLRHHPHICPQKERVATTALAGSGQGLAGGRGAVRCPPRGSPDAGVTFLPGKRPALLAPASRDQEAPRRRFPPYLSSLSLFPLQSHRWSRERGEAVGVQPAGAAAGQYDRPSGSSTTRFSQSSGWEPQTRTPADLVSGDRHRISWLLRRVLRRPRTLSPHSVEGTARSPGSLIQGH